MKDGKARVPAEDGSSSTIVVRNLPESTTSSQLSDFFAALAPIQHAFVVTKKTDEGIQCEGYGFVTFTTKQDAAAIAAKQSVPFTDNATVTLAFAKPRKRRHSEVEGADAEAPPKKDVQPSKDPSIPSLRPRLIFRNLSWKVRNSAQLENVVKAIGVPKEIQIPRGDHGRMKGFAFVEMKTRKAAAKVIEMVNGMEIEGRPIAVDWCVSKDEWNDHKPAKEDEEELEAKTEDEDDGILEDSDEEDEEEEEEVMDEDGEENDGESPSPTSETIFIRNIPYLVTRSTLFNLFRPLGHISSLYLVTDPTTSLSRGTAFLTFSESAPAETLLTLSSALKSGTAPPEQIERYTLEGRTLHFLSAVSHTEADRLKTEHATKKHDDRRNFFLLNEGQIDSREPLYEKLSGMDLALRRDSLKMRKEQLAANPSLHLSQTRLAVRNIPRTFTEREFRELAIKAVSSFDEDVKNDLRADLTEEEKARDPGKHGKRALIQAKIVEEKTGRSRGYGFLEYNCHENALKGLRWLNARVVGARNVEGDGDRKRRLVVEFALENAQVVKRRRERQEASRRKAAVAKKEKKGRRKEEEVEKVEPPKKKQKGVEGEKPSGPDIGKIIAKKRFIRKKQRGKQGK